jgi:hypothetical protein
MLPPRHRVGRCPLLLLLLLLLTVLQVLEEVQLHR